MPKKQQPTKKVIQPKAEEGLSRSEEKYRNILNNMQDSYMEVDLAGNFTYVNPATCQNVRYTAEELIGKNFRIIMPGNDELKAVFEAYNRVYKTGEPNSGISFKVLRKDGSTGYGEMSISLLKDEQGGSIGFRSIGRDVTERKNSEEKLKESAERLREVLENSLDASYKRNMVTDIYDYISPSITEISGYTPEEMNDLPLATVKNLIHPDDSAEAQRVVVKSLANPDNKPYRLEYRLKHKQGAYRWVRDSYTVRRDEKGKPLAIIGSISDITDRKTAEYTLKESETKYRFLTDTTRDIIWIMDMDLHTTYVSPSVEAALGFTTEERMKQDVKEQLTPESLLVAQDTLARELANELSWQSEPNRPITIESEYYRKDGSTSWFENIVTGIRDDQGNLIGLHGVSRNIDERKNAEHKLQESEKRARKISQLTNDITHSCLTDDNGSYCIDWLSGATERITGYTVDEIIAQSCWKYIVVEEDIPLFEKHVDGLAVGQSSSCQLRIRSKNGDIKWISFQAECTADLQNSQRRRLYGGLTDITDRRRLKEEQQRVEKLESVGLLAGGIAHDFNNILTAILGNISLARMEAAPGSELKNSLEQAEKAAQRAKALTVQLLTFSKGGAPVKKLASLTELLIDTAGFALRGSRVKCQFSVPDDLWQAEIDTGQVSQVIHNLVINAQQAMPDGGTIEVTAENIVLSEAQSLGKGLPVTAGDYIRIAVADHGSGIPVENLDKLFDPFFSTKPKGSGLGLATSFSIARQHGGHISVESIVDSGSTFYLYLPASRQAEIPSQDKKDTAKFVSKSRILLMDDEKGIRAVAERMLRHIGYKDIACVSDGTEAIKLYKEAMECGQPFGAVILDLTIPGGMGGEVAIKKLLKIDPGVKAIVSSGYIEDSVMANYKEHGFSARVAKPYTVEELHKAVQDVLG